MTLPPPDNSDPRDYILDLSSAPAPPREFTASAPNTNPSQRPRISIYFRCCQTYSHIYLNARKSAYAGHCPKCRRQAVVPTHVVTDNERIFVAE